MESIPGGKTSPVLGFLQPGNGAHSAIVQQKDAAPCPMLDPIDQDLWVHRERPVSGQRQGVERP